MITKIDIVTSKIGEYLDCHKNEQIISHSINDIYNGVLGGILNTMYINIISIDNIQKLKNISNMKFNKNIIIDILDDEISDNTEILKFFKVNPTAILKRLHTINYTDFPYINVKEFELVIDNYDKLKLQNFSKMNIEKLTIIDNNTEIIKSNMLNSFNAHFNIMNFKTFNLFIINSFIYYYGLKLPKTVENITIEMHKLYDDYDEYERMMYEDHMYDLINTEMIEYFVDDLINLKYFECNYINSNDKQAIITYLNNYNIEHNLNFGNDRFSDDVL